MSQDIAPTHPTGRTFLRPAWLRNRLLLATVVAPTVIAAAYFGGLASDVYLSESRFVLRTPQRQAISPLGSLLQSSGFAGLARTADDAFMVSDYLVSRDALGVADNAVNLRQAFGGERVDLFSRFPGFDGDTSTEALHRYYQRRVTVHLDTASSIVTLSVRAFGRTESHAINEELLRGAEALVNRLNERARADIVKAAEVEAATAEQRVTLAAAAVSAYRNANLVMDPEKQSTLRLQQTGKLQDELIATRTQMAQLQALTPENPQLPGLQVKARALRAEIQSETMAVAGGSASLAAKAQEFERLQIEREFADKQYAASMASLEMARNEALRKQVYLERVVQPNTPDVALEPRRLYAVLSVFGLGMLSWGVLSLLLASVKEHRA